MLKKQQKKQVLNDCTFRCQRDRESCKKAFKEINNKYGHINVLVNNAGINRTADFDKQTEDEWNEVINVNLTGPFRCY